MANVGSTTPVAESPKVSMMVKAGLNFVIPKNKLSGAMIPVSKSTTKWEPLDPKKEEVKPPARKTKWGPDLTQDSSVKRGRALALQTRAEQLAAQLESGNLDIDNNEETRSPSPPPLYDTLGHRMNTREGRKRELLDLERREAIGECMKLNPVFKPPSGFKPVTKEAKLYIPAKEHPGYNFIGLILGPRGNTQKRMESETGAKITIRGKGAVKEGKMQSARNGKDTDGTSEELHVHISADSYEKVDAAIAIIEPLLTPVDEDRNMHKMKQLRELAEMNGTLNDFTKVCSLCGEAGHKEWQCTKDKLQTFQANVICQLCGDGGHPTIDCPLKGSGQGITFDKEYLSFLEELGTGLHGNTTEAKADHPSDANTSQPMLLTTNGAQPLPPRWIAPPIGTDSAGNFVSRGLPDGISPAGVFPRLPNLPGFQGVSSNPPGSQVMFPNHPGIQGMPPNLPGSQGMNLFPPRSSQPAAVPPGFLRGPPFPGATFPIVPRMLPATRGQVPAPPSGFACDMRPPVLPVVPAGMLRAASTNTITPAMQTQALGSANEGTIRGSQSLSSTQVENERNFPNTMPVASAPSSSMAPSFPGTALAGALNRPPVFVSPMAHSIPPTVRPVPPSLTSNPDSARPVLPLPPVQVAVPPPVIHPVRPVVSSVRPVLPSVRPMSSIAAEAPRGPGQGLCNGVPPFGRTLDDTLPSGNSSFLHPPQPLSVGLMTQGQGQYSGPAPPSLPLASTLEKSSFGPLPHPFPSPSTPPFPPSARISGPIPASDPGQTMIRTPPSLFPSTLSPSFPPILPQTPQSQFVITPNNPVAAQPSSHPSSRPVFPPLLGTQIRPINPSNAMSLMGGNSLPSSEQNIVRQPQQPPRPPMLLNAQLLQQGNALPRAEFPLVRHPHPVPARAPVRAEFRNPGLHQPGILVPPASILGSPGFSRPPVQMAPQEALSRGYSANFSRPAPPTNPLPTVASRSSGAVNVPWEAGLSHRNRPDVLHIQGQSGMMINKSRNVDPHMRPQLLNVPMPQKSEVDPEYEKLMASVGVL